MTAPAAGQVSLARGRADARTTPQQGSWETITAALESAVGPGRAAGAWTRYCCPAHEAGGGHHNPSLGIKYDQAQQRTVVRCFAGCDNELVLEKVGLRVADMFDRRPDRTPGRRYTPAPRPRQLSRADRAIDAAGLPLAKPKKDLGQQLSPWKTTAVYGYTRADGSVAGEVIRHEARFEHGRDKRFHQRARTETGWADTGFEHVPFQLPSVLEAIAERRTVYVCEGEKDCLAAERAGLTATTNAGGALSWTAEHAAWLKGAGSVVIVADRDPAGYRRAERVMASLVGLVDRVRVVQAATGKDLHDHLQAGHEVGELEPIPHLDPFTATAPTPEIPAAETDVVSAASSAPSKGPATMETRYAYGANPPAPVGGHDEVDHISGQWTAFMRILMQFLLAKVARQVAATIAAAEKRAKDKEEEQQRAEAKLAADRAAAEAKLRRMRESGFANCSRREIAEAVAEASAWSEHSEVARRTLEELKVHVRQRFGIELDTSSGHAVVTSGPTPEVAVALQAAEAEKAAGERVKSAQDHMVELVAKEDLDQATKEELYDAIKQWREHPTDARLAVLTKKLADKGVKEATRTQVRYIASYLGTPDQQVPLGQLDTTASVSATRELRKLPAPLVDPGEEAKPRIDQLLEAYQDKLRAGASTAAVRERLDKAMAALTPEDRKAVRERGNAIRSNPVGRYARLWPDHVDREELAATVRMYANLASQAEATVVRADGAEAHVVEASQATADAMSKAAAKHRAWIEKAIKTGKGLHPLERSQLKAVLVDIEAGKTTVPEVLFADDRSAAAADATDATRRAHDAAYAHRRQVEKVLDTNAVPRGTLRRVRDELTKVTDGHAAMARGHASLSDHERSGVTAKLDLRLQAAGVPQAVRNQVRARLDLAAGEAASMGKQALRIADRWDERHEKVVADRAPAAPAYDSREHTAQRESALRSAGLDPDQVKQQMAADAGQATPAAKAVKRDPSQRTTAPGEGVHRINHRKGRGEPGMGR